MACHYQDPSRQDVPLIVGGEYVYIGGGGSWFLVLVSHHETTGQCRLRRQGTASSPTWMGEGALRSQYNYRPGGYHGKPTVSRRARGW